jgi:para-aminobenzoate synthetase component 1
MRAIAHRIHRLDHSTVHQRREKLDRPPSSGHLPLVEPIGAVENVEPLFRRLAALPGCVLFDSARRDPVLGRYSFLAADPFDWLEVAADGSDGLARLRQAIAGLAAERVPGLPPFQGGAAGLLGYDLGRSLERLPCPRFDEFQAPALAVGLYDVVLAIDHVDDQAWIISQGFPETGPAARRRRAEERLRQFQSWLAAPPRACQRPPNEPLPIEALAPQFPAGKPAGLVSNFSRDGYLDAVGRAIEYIRAGDIFQVNLSQRLLYPAQDDAVELYLRLRRRNPATFAGYFDLGRFQILSASPERFLQVRERQVETRPIKGTRPRTARPEADLFSGDELRESEKDRAENVMIVDLLRNDLSKVCRPQSVCVTQLCKLETYEYVQHLVSAVRGTLRDECDAPDLVRAAFPGGSISGAPKVRAMEIIAELEPTARGAYCGCLGYLGFDGTLDTNLLIRTITAGRGWWQLPVGGGIIAQSVPQREYEETWHKAEGLIRALN